MKSKLGKINRIFRINFFLSLLFFAVFLAADVIDNPIDRILSSDYDVSTIKIIREKSYLNSDILFIHGDQ